MRRQGSAGRVDDDVRVGRRFAEPARGAATDRADERVIAVDHDPDDRPVGGAPVGRGLDLDLFGGREKGELAGFEAHEVSVAHLASIRW